MTNRSAFLGLITRRERWSLSWKGWLVCLLGFVGLSAFVFLGLHPFLAPTRRVNSDLLVVEGWIHDAAIRGAAAEFTNGHYKHVFSTGGPVLGSSGYINDFNTSASVGADRLKAAGLPSNVVHMVPTRVKDRDRTYSAAIALRDWFRANKMQVRRINVVTEGVHARRSRLLFQRAFGDDVEVGIISIPSIDYDAARWWRYSEGVKEIMSEGGAYLYVRLFFWPGSDQRSGR